MNLQKILNNINIFLKKSISSTNGKKTRKSILLNKVKQTTFIKKRRCIVIKSFNLEKFKIFGNNKSNYYLILSFLLLLIIIYIISGPIFRIKNIEIIKQDNITNMLIAYKAVDKYRGKNIFSIEKKDILQKLQNYQHNIHSIKTNIILPNTIKIIINSHLGVFNTTINNKTYIITENGTLIPSIYSEELKELKIKNQFDKNNFLDYKETFETKYITKISKIIDYLQENIVSLKIKELDYYVIERELHIETEKNTTLIFNLNSNIEEQIEKIVIFNKEHINIDKNTIIYIDLRIKNKVFYCTNENEYQCIQNIKSVYSKE